MNMRELNEECSLFRPSVGLFKEGKKVMLGYYDKEGELLCAADSKQTAVNQLPFHGWVTLIDGFVLGVEAARLAVGLEVYREEA